MGVRLRPRAFNSRYSFMDAPAKISLRTAFGHALREQEPLSRYTSARLGGPAEFLVIAETADQLAELVRTAWRFEMTPLILGGGSNVLVSDLGVRGVVIINRARGLEINDQGPDRVVVRVESGANLGALARQCVAQGLSGLEWAATVPGTVGGAVYGNAGAHGGDMAGNLLTAEVLQPDGTVRYWTRAELAFSYRSSALKRNKNLRPVILAAELALTRGEPRTLQAKVEEFVAHRKRTQPPGASLGSMFKNPAGDHAGRLIEAAGLKGRRVGNVEVSPQHANFFVNLGEARAADVFALIHIVHDTVKEKFGVDLELEVELVGEWGGNC